MYIYIYIFFFSLSLSFSYSLFYFYGFTFLKLPPPACVWRTVTPYRFVMVRYGASTPHVFGNPSGRLFRSHSMAHLVPMVVAHWKPQVEGKSKQYQLHVISLVASKLPKHVLQCCEGPWTFKSWGPILLPTQWILGLGWPRNGGSSICSNVSLLHASGDPQGRRKKMFRSRARFPGNHPRALAHALEDQIHDKEKLLLSDHHLEVNVMRWYLVRAAKWVS